MEKAFEEQRKPEKNQRRKEKDVRRNTLFGSVRSIFNFQLKKLYQNLIIKWIWHKKNKTKYQEIGTTKCICSGPKGSYSHEKIGS